MDCNGVGSCQWVSDGRVSYEAGSSSGGPSFAILIFISSRRINVLMNAVVGANLYHGFGIGNGNDVWLTHLQFADDTLIIGLNGTPSVYQRKWCW